MADKANHLFIGFACRYRLREPTMSLSPSRQPPSSASLSTRLLRALAVAMTISLMFYGLIAIDAGIVNYRGAGSRANGH